MTLNLLLTLLLTVSEALTLRNDPRSVRFISVMSVVSVIFRLHISIIYFGYISVKYVAFPMM